MLNVVQVFCTLPNLAVVRVCLFACTRGNTEIFAQIETVQPWNNWGWEVFWVWTPIPLEIPIVTPHPSPLEFPLAFHGNCGCFLEPHIGMPLACVHYCLKTSYRSDILCFFIDQIYKKWLCTCFNAVHLHLDHVQTIHCACLILTCTVSCWIQQKTCRV